MCPASASPQICLAGWWWWLLCRVLGALPWLPFADPADRWSLAADALACVRLALTSGAQGSPWAGGPKSLGPPTGIRVTVLAARVVYHLAIAGERLGTCLRLCA